MTIQLGPQYSYLIKQKNAFSNAATSIEQAEEFKNENIRKNTLCFIGGLDINIQRIVIGARAGWDIQNNNGDGTSTAPRYKNAWTQLTMGFRLLDFLRKSFSTKNLSFWLQFEQIIRP